jgi:hypothetical protein
MTQTNQKAEAAALAGGIERGSGESAILEKTS